MSPLAYAVWIEIDHINQKDRAAHGHRLRMRCGLKLHQPLLSDPQDRHRLRMRCGLKFFFGKALSPCIRHRLRMRCGLKYRCRPPSPQSGLRHRLRMRCGLKSRVIAA